MEGTPRPALPVTDAGGLSEDLGKLAKEAAKDEGVVSPGGAWQVWPGT